LKKGVEIALEPIGEMTKKLQKTFEKGKDSREPYEGCEKEKK